MGTMTLLQWQAMLGGGMLLIGMVALFCRRIFWFRGCIGLGILTVAALQLLIVSPERKGHSRLPFRLGLDLRGGTELRLRLHPDRARVERLHSEQQALIALQATAAPNPERQMEISRLGDSISREEVRLEEQFSQAVDIVRYRLTGIGVGDIAVMRDGRDRILIQLPDMDSQQADMIVKTVEQQGVLAFHMIRPRSGPQGHAALYAAIEKQGVSTDLSGIASDGTLDPEGAFDWLRTPDTTTEDGEVRSGYFRVVERSPLLAGSHIIAARAASDHRGEAWRVQVEFDPEGSQQFLQTTRDHHGRQLGILLDGRLVSAPYIGETVDEGRTEIVGAFSESEAHHLAIVLQSGALKVRVSRESQMRIGPSLGEDSVRRGLRSLIVGLVAVIVFMIITYRAAGLIAVAALLANLAILAALLSALDAAVALPGIAGAILLIGITVDSAVLIYERLREEQKQDAPLHSAVHAAYDRAFTTIVDANVTTILAAGILYFFATDIVRGFCLVLIIGILTGLFCSLVGIRWMLDAVAERGTSARLHMLKLPQLPLFDFAGRHRRAALISLLLVGGSVLLFGWLQHCGEAFGTEFTGGLRMQFRLSQPQRVEAVRQQIQSHLKERMPAAAITLRSQGKSVAIEGGQGQHFSEFSLTARKGRGNRVGSTPLAGMEQAVREAFEEKGHQRTVIVQAASQMGPMVAREMRRATLAAVGLALAAIFLYIVFRFRMRLVFGWVAVLTLVHDVIITLGVLLLAGQLGWVSGGIDLKVAAALLTVIGYSLNDTIVVFDRIRENSTSGAISSSIVNISINQVLMRTLITSLTTLLVVVALLMLGGSVIRGFAFTLLVGIVVGTYSSIFIAGPMVARPARPSPPA
ncbi:MAG: protein translocase subunit SecD [Verrucomicrobia bacterium]|jgi:SecD/SecF fusion protein|nr:protein translocase subunit SecD [Verrucomicrobiota bacterium]MBT7068046.1 protein translocase subunit SecD [Verrucomicrobiota bacterium]MBT7700233.1 protein translocase subunit SecD [Verrucomicrobiota bacterium]